MTFVEPTTQFVSLGNTPDSPSLIIKDTITVEDVVFLYARTRAASRLDTTVQQPEVMQTVRQQITRVPHVR